MAEFTYRKQPKNEVEEEITEEMEEIVNNYFRPNKEQQLAKYNLLKLCEVKELEYDKLDTKTVQALLLNFPVKTWLGKPGFKNWLMNSQEEEERKHLLISLAYDAAEEILQNRDPKAQSARVQMVKTMMELGDRFPKKQLPQVQFMDSQIQSMSKEQLESFITKSGAQITQTIKREITAPTTIEVENGKE